MTNEFKKYEISIIVRKGKGEFEIESLDKIQHDSLLGALSQLPFVIATIQEKQYRNIVDDDIPF